METCKHIQGIWISGESPKFEFILTDRDIDYKRPEGYLKWFIFCPQCGIKLY